MEDKSKPTKELSVRSRASDIALDIGSSVAGAIVGLAIGGPAGAIAGAATPAVVSNAISSFAERRAKRGEKIINDALKIAGKEYTVLLDTLKNNEDESELLIQLVQLAISSDPKLDQAFSSLISQLIVTNGDVERDRLLIIGQAIKNLNRVHLKVLRSLDQNNGENFAADISEELKIPEIELRNVVRDLEARGMIKDLEVHPIKWKLRELGEVIVSYSKKEGAI